MTDADTRPPVPVALLVDHVCSDGGDYNDGLQGWSGASFDPETGFLAMVFDPASDIPRGTWMSDYGPTLVRFKLTNT
jgi:hypothetical protein